MELGKETRDLFFQDNFIYFGAPEGENSKRKVSVHFGPGSEQEDIKGIAIWRYEFEPLDKRYVDLKYEGTLTGYGGAELKLDNENEEKRYIKDYDFWKKSDGGGQNSPPGMVDFW